jgi:hypothetical protein
MLLSSWLARLPKPPGLAKQSTRSDTQAFKNKRLLQSSFSPTLGSFARRIRRVRADSRSGRGRLQLSAFPLSAEIEWLESRILLSGAPGFTTIDPPGSTNTQVSGVSGNNVVGSYADNSGNHGFLYNASTAAYTTINAPGSISTSASDVSGSTVVGTYEDNNSVSHGFLYNATTASYTTIDPPGSRDTTINAISGSIVVGYYDVSGYGFHFQYGFSYNVATSVYTTIDPPGTANVDLTAVSGSTILGSYFVIPVLGFPYGFLYNVTTASYTILSDPGVSVPGQVATIPSGSSGNNVVGDNYDPGGINSYGFLYNTSTATYTTIAPDGSAQTYVTGVSGSNVVGSAVTNFVSLIYQGFLYNASTNTYATIDAPGSIQTFPQGISGNNVFGSYTDSNGVYRGFVYQDDFVVTVVAPSSLTSDGSAVVTVEYQNIGATPMAAPVLQLTASQNGNTGAFLTLDPSLMNVSNDSSTTPSGFGQSVEILASGDTPGILEPGESGAVAVYYGGWLSSQWDAASPGVAFTVSALFADNSTPIDWPSM